MSNVLKVSLQTTIYSLANRGWSQQLIARELGLNRETVGRYLRLAKPAILTTDDEEGAGAKPAIPITGNQAGQDESKLDYRRCLWAQELLRSVGRGDRRQGRGRLKRPAYLPGFGRAKRLTSLWRCAAATELGQPKSSGTEGRLV